MSLKYKKKYIDTRYKTPDSNSTSDFKISLPESISFGGDTAFYIDDFTCGHSWTSIEDFNNKFYLHLHQQAYAVNTNWSFIITIENGNYTGADFALELQSKIRSYTNVIIYNLFNVVYNPKIII